MKYYEKHSCGHEGMIDLVGKTKDREWRIEKYFSSTCPECQKEKREVENKKRNEENKEKSQKMNLPELTGTEKQIAWAMTIRMDYIKKMEECRADVNALRKAYCQCVELKAVEKMSADEFKKISIAAVTHTVENETTSEFWIENRNEYKIATCIKMHREA